MIDLMIDLRSKPARPEARRRSFRGARASLQLRYGSREFGDRCSAISIGSWIFPEFLTKRPDEDVCLLAEEQSELVNIP